MKTHRVTLRERVQIAESETDYLCKRLKKANDVLSAGANWRSAEKARDFAMIRGDSATHSQVDAVEVAIDRLRLSVDEAIEHRDGFVVMDLSRKGYPGNDVESERDSAVESAAKWEDCANRYASMYRDTQHELALCEERAQKAIELNQGFYSYKGVLGMLRAVLDEHYPASIFDGSSQDSGAIVVASAHKLIDAMRRIETLEDALGMHGAS
jgi:hypothetical protein